MAGFKDAPTLADAQRLRRAQPKPSREARRKQTTRAKIADDVDVREKVWRFDGGRSRASGRRLFRSSADLSRLGVVAHILARGSHPELKFDLRNVCLLSFQEHADSDPRTANAGGKALLEIRGRNANRALTFIRRDRDGRELSRYTSRRTGR